ncbi:hypothetical protein [Arthrobacter russicus]|uniref:Uncharacterized protein n=1 Tax=Arthrobacter russicus TaxID=172040 RepID=A0ABU1JBN9_9MICC|nr:hypothetical protein [Arthrobacter russicus]MDN5668561.1 hypothetical protein [Renibacterium salmoninarum]MDR6269560.1 hypothetical protein [Arthrobacter russicus]
MPPFEHQETGQNQPEIRFAPAVESKLSDAARESLARKQAQAGQPGVPGLTRGHKPTHVSGKQGKRERKVRW